MSLKFGPWSQKYIGLDWIELDWIESFKRCTKKNTHFLFPVAAAVADRTAIITAPVTPVCYSYRVCYRIYCAVTALIFILRSGLLCFAWFAFAWWLIACPFDLRYTVVSPFPYGSMHRIEDTVMRKEPWGFLFCFVFRCRLFGRSYDTSRGSSIIL